MMTKYGFYLCIYCLLLGCHNGDKPVISQTFAVESRDDLTHYAVTPEHHVILDLEKNSGHTGDTGDVGTDRFDVRIEDDHSRTYCFDEDGNITRRLLIHDARGRKVLALESGYQSVFLHRGIYRYTLINGSATPHTVFVVPQYPYDLTGYQPNRTDTARSIDATNKNRSRAVQETKNTRRTLISFHRCVGCNLNNINLSHKAFSSTFRDSMVSLRLNEEYLKSLGYASVEDFFAIQNQDKDAYGEANTRDDLNVSHASLRGADLSYSVFKNAVFDGVDFTEANLSHAVFDHCSFQGARFDKTDMTQAVFWAPEGFAKTLSYRSKIISRPSLTTLYGEPGGHIRWDFDLIAALNDRYRVVVYWTWGNRYDELQPLPNGVAIVSSPAIATNNYDAGYSVFVQGSDGYLYEYLDYGRTVKGNKYLPTNRQWHKISNTYRMCVSDPAVYFENYNGFAELRVLLACRGTGTRLHRWHRFFYNNTYDFSWYGAGDKNYRSWKWYGFSVSELGGQIAINRAVHVASIDRSNMLYFKSFNYGNYTYGRNIAKPFYRPFASEVALHIHQDGLAAFVQEDGKVYEGDLYTQSFTDYGHPPYGVVSTPSLGSMKSTYKVVVLSGDGMLYARDDRNGWKEVGDYADDSSHIPFVFRHNDLHATYFYQANLTGVLDGSNHYAWTFFDDVPLRNVHFDKTTLDHVTFYNTHLDSGTTVKASILRDVTFRFARVADVDFTKSRFEGATWRNSRFECTVFDRVAFSNDPVYARDNAYACSSQDKHASFKHAKNIPVELLGGFDVATVATQNPEFIRDFDFSSASFKNLTALDFSGAVMKGAKFGGIDSRPGVDMSGIHAPDSSWIDADLSYVRCRNGDFRNARFQNTSLYQAKMDGSDFTQSRWQNVDASYANIQNASMLGFFVDETSRLRYASFAGSSLQTSTLKNVDARGANFTQADLSCSNLQSIRLDAASVFDSAYLSGADLTRNGSSHIKGSFVRSDFSGANFSSVTFGVASLTDATFDFSGVDVLYDVEGDRCKGYVIKPLSTRDTICPDGQKHTQGCSF